MADYWKSQPRKFCEFCKCWITDNKPSVEFHERGKRHKENVQKKIDELRKRSGEKAKEQDELNAGLAYIEKAALEALKKDLAQDPSLAAQYGVKLKTAGPQTEEEAKAQTSTTAPAADIPKIKEWFEAKSPEGYTYYWNISTNESVWDPPTEYMSLTEQEEKTAGASQSQESLQSEEEIDEEYEEEIEQLPPKKILRVDPVGARGAAYGAWTTIREEPPPEPEDEPEPDPEPESVPKAEEPLSTELPTLSDIPLPGHIPLPGEIPLPVGLPVNLPLPSKSILPDYKLAPTQETRTEVKDYQPQASVKKDSFKEKTVASLGLSSGGGVGFKKRKIAASARNARQRDGDD